MKSILENEKKCWFCGTTKNLHKHHVFGGLANRKLSERYGLTVHVCGKHHNLEDRNSVHYNNEMGKLLKRYAQIKFESKYTDLDFIKIFGRNYIDKS